MFKLLLLELYQKKKKVAFIRTKHLVSLINVQSSDPVMLHAMKKVWKIDDPVILEPTYSSFLVLFPRTFWLP